MTLQDTSTYLFLAVILAVLYRRFSTKAGRNYPPSPPADPIIGHARFIPPTHQGVYFHKLREKYGDVIYLNVLGKPMVVVNSAKAAVDLLEKRGLNYSDRPRLVMLAEILGANVFSFLNYATHVIKQRSMLVPLFTRTESRRYEPVQLREAQFFTNNLLRKPEQYDLHIRRFTAAVVIEIAYGHRVTRDDDHYIKRADNFSYAVANSGPIGATPPDVFPILKYLPEWFPGAWWIQYGKQQRPNVRGIIDYPFEDVLRQMAEGTAKPSFVRNLMENLQSSGKVTKEDEEDVKAAAAVIFGAGAETSWSTILVFMFSLVVFPEVQKRAQEELFSVIGSDQLPSFTDRASLPYLECFLQEVLRWSPALPLGIPHFSRNDDYYENMLIPGRSTVFANAYGIGHDSVVYADADAFRPERFLPKPEGAGEPFLNATFGYGRRGCPGKWMAEAGVWIVMAYTLATFNVSPVIGNDGKEIMPDREFLSGPTCQPKPFKCNIVPRSARAVQLVEQAVAQHD